MSRSMESWLHARFREALSADEALPAARLFTGKAPEGTPLPYGRLTPSDARASQWTAAGASVGLARARLTIRAAGLEEARGLAIRCEAGLAPPSPPEEGILDVCRLRESAAEELDGVWTFSVDYEILWQRPVG